MYGTQIKEGVKSKVLIRVINIWDLAVKYCGIYGRDNSPGPLNLAWCQEIDSRATSFTLG